LYTKCCKGRGAHEVRAIVKHEASEPDQLKAEQGEALPMQAPIWHFVLKPDMKRVLAAVVGCVALAGSSWQAAAVSIELKDVASDRVERQRAAAEGNLPLAGTPDLSRLSERLTEKGLKLGSPVLLRAFKSESEFEVWVRNDEHYVLFATYPVCHWSGTLGPKLHEGDRQTPEGFYTVTKPQMKHVGRWPRSLNLGFPNVYDQVLARNGSHILVHGGCSSVGCFAMTNAVIEEIYSLVEQAVSGGQTFVPVHVFPFRLTDANLALQKNSPWLPFWSNLKEGFDFVEKAKQAPKITVCEGRYKFQSLAPQEGSEAGPLVPCGETHAALQVLEQLSPAARTQLSFQLNPQVSAPRSLQAHQHLHLNRPSSNIRADAGSRSRGSSSQSGQRLLGPQVAGITMQGAGLIRQRPPCSTARASCRHYLATRDQAQERRVATGRKKQQQAQR
jgi:murein L,D-transpeptidase YafK